MGVTRDLARELGPVAANGAVFRQGVVSAVNSDGTVTLTLGGSVATVTSVRCLASVMPYVGATVWCAQFAQDLLVVGVQEVATGWVTSTTGFTAATNWSVTSVRYRRVGNDVTLYVVAGRTTVDLTIAAGSGDITNVDVLSATPTSIRPAQPQYLYSGSTGRTLTGYIAADGTAGISNVAGDGTNITTANSVSLFGRYWID